MEEQILLDCLFPNPKARKFSCNGLFEEIKIPFSICYSNRNKKEEVRKENYKIIERTIRDFLKEEDKYNTVLLVLYDSNNVDEIIEDLVKGYVFFRIITSKRYKSVDIFNDRKCVCFLEFSTMICVMR